MRKLFLTLATLIATTTLGAAQETAPTAPAGSGPPRPDVMPELTDQSLGSAEECAAEIRADPATAREKAALWYRLGGGTEARLCEAAALEAMGADATAAQVLTGVAQNPNRAMDMTLRALTYEDAARLWLRVGRADLARDAILSANRVTDPGAGRWITLARAEAAEANWAEARGALDAALALEPDDATAITLRAATLRHLGDIDGALAEARRALGMEPDQPAAMFEEAAALATKGDDAGASRAWLRLIEVHPESDLAPAARRNLQTLSEAARGPTPRPRTQPEPRPRPDAPPPG